jgi:hypothetical protein
LELQVSLDPELELPEQLGQPLVRPFQRGRQG